MTTRTKNPKNKINAKPKPIGYVQKRSDREIVFGDLRERTQLIEKIYNPEQINLHFTSIPHTDAALFEALYSIGMETWNEIQKDPHRFALGSLYDIFLLITGASLKIAEDNTQEEYSKSLVHKIAFLLVDALHLTCKDENMGDITKRNDEALRCFLHAFPYLSDAVNKKARKMKDPAVMDFVKRVTESAEG